MKKLLLVATLLIGPALVLAQGGAQGGAQAPAQSDLRAVVPGHPDWKGQTVQIGQPNPAPDTGGLDPATIMKPLAEQWTSYSGDLSGKRFSALKQVNTATVKNLSLKWHNTLPTGCGPTARAVAGRAVVADAAAVAGRGRWLSRGPVAVAADQSHRSSSAAGTRRTIAETARRVAAFCS